MLRTTIQFTRPDQDSFVTVNEEFVDTNYCDIKYKLELTIGQHARRKDY